MWKAKLCMNVNSSGGISEEEKIRILHEVGFDGFFTLWVPEKIAVWRELADELGMEYAFIHAPFTKSAAMWQEGEKAEEAVRDLLECVEDCARYHVPILVMHAFIGFKDHSPTQEGIINFGKVIDAAERLGVKIAFENTEGEEYLSALMDAFKGRDHVGFCWDTGHEMCYNHSQDMMALYGDRLLCTHINDNLGIRDYEGRITFIDDLHLLLFDGVADWKWITSTVGWIIGSMPQRHLSEPAGWPL